MSQITTTAVIAPSFVESSSDLENTQDIGTPAKCSNGLSPSVTGSSFCKENTRLISVNVAKAFSSKRGTVLGSERSQVAFIQKSNENLNDNVVFDNASEPKAITKIEPVDTDCPEETYPGSTLQLSLGGFTSNTEKQSFNFLNNNRKGREAVLQPISYDNARNCSLRALNHTHSDYSQQFQRTQPQASALQQLTIFSQLHPNALQDYQNNIQSVGDRNQKYSSSFQTTQNNFQLRPNGNRKYSNAFQLILNGFPPHTNSCQTFTNGRLTYANASPLHPSAMQSNLKEIQPSQNDRPLPLTESQSCSSGNYSLPNDFYRHSIHSLVQLNTSESSSTSNKSQPNGSPPPSSVDQVQPNRNGNQLPSSDKQLDSSESRKRTFVDVIEPLEKCFRGDTCLLCGFKSSAKWPCRARQHLITHLDRKDFKCTTCAKGFTTPEYQLEHERTHEEEPTFACSVCGGKFRTRTSLHRHQKIHEEIKFQCPFCETQLATRAGFKRHLTIHTGELPHQCSLCPKRFRTARSLRLHVAAHAGEKLFSCRVCSKGFNAKGLYEQHFATHREDGMEAAFGCNECGKRFNFRSNLAQHLKTHSEDRRHECGECRKRFKFPHHLRSHLATHGDTPTVKTEE